MFFSNLHKKINIKQIVFIIVIIIIIISTNKLFFLAEIGDVDKPLNIFINSDALNTYLLNMPPEVKNELNYLQLNIKEIQALVRSLPIFVIYYPEFTESILDSIFQTLKSILGPVKFGDIKNYIIEQSLIQDKTLNDSLINYCYRV